MTDKRFKLIYINIFCIMYVVKIYGSISGKSHWTGEQYK